MQSFWSMTKRKRVGGRPSVSGAKTQDSTSDGTEGREKKRRKRSTSPNTDPVSVGLIWLTSLSFSNRVYQERVCEKPHCSVV